MLKKCKFFQNWAMIEGIIAKNCSKVTGNHHEFSLQFWQFFGCNSLFSYQIWVKLAFFQRNFCRPRFLVLWNFLKNQNFEFFFKKPSISHCRELNFCMEYLAGVSWFQKYVPWALSIDLHLIFFVTHCAISRPSVMTNVMENYNWNLN